MARAGKFQHFSINILQWIKVQLRIVALERSGAQLSYRFSFDADLSTIVCRVYFSDVESNPLAAVSAAEQNEIYGEWIDLGLKYIRECLDSCELPSGFSLVSTVRFILHVSEGMGAKIVEEAERSLKWSGAKATADKRRKKF